MKEREKNEREGGRMKERGEELKGESGPLY